MKVNPVYKNELKIRIRSIRTANLLVWYNGLLALFGLFAFYVTFEYDSKYTGTVNYSDILQIYSIITALEFGLVLFIVPALTSSSISGEREKQTLEILLTTKLTPIQIILGKLASSISMMILLAFSSLPVLALTFSIGGISLQNLFEFMFFIMVTAVFIGSIGIFYSTLFKKTTIATVFTYGTLLLIGAGTIIILSACTTIKGLYINRFITPDEIKKIPKAGNLIYILLINPVISFISMTENQIGTGSVLTNFFSQFGTNPIEYQDAWFLKSITIQLIISGVLLKCSSQLLDPLRKHYLYKRKNRRKDLLSEKYIGSQN